MNLFRSEEHVKNWSDYDPISAEAIMPLADWAAVFSGPLFRNRLDPDMIINTRTYWADFFARLANLGRTGSFWRPE